VAAHDPLAPRAAACVTDVRKAAVMSHRTRRSAPANCSARQRTATSARHVPVSHTPSTLASACLGRLLPRCPRRSVRRAPIARAEAAAVRRLKAAGSGPAEIARRLGIGRASVYRILADAAAPMAPY
jgi:hypothetical protein